MTDEVTAPPAAEPAAKPVVQPPPEAAVGDVAAQKPQTLVDDVDGGKAVASPAGWPEDWQVKLAGGDEKELARLKRFKSPEGVMKSWRELETKLASGEYKREIPKDATPEQMAEWRKERGIPDSHEAYKFDLGGIVPPEADKPVLDAFKRFAHEKNWTPAHLNEVAKFYYEQQETLAVDRANKDQTDRTNGIAALRSEWGQDYALKSGAISNFLAASVPGEFVDTLMEARLPDGSRLGANVEFFKWVAKLAQDAGMSSGVAPGGGEASGKSIPERLEELNKLYASDYESYMRQNLKVEHTRLLEARDRQKSQAA